MKNLFKVSLLLCLLLIAFGVNRGFCDSPAPKIAVVDFDRVAKNSSRYENLKKYQAQKTKELRDFMVSSAQAVENEKDAGKKKTLQQNFNKQYKQKKTEIENRYAIDVQQIDAIVEQKVQKVARDMGYTLVLTKRSVLYGGDDITERVVAEVK